MSKKKKSYLSIPDDFNGFSYKEVKIRRAVLELRRDALRQKMSKNVENIGNSIAFAGEKIGKAGKFLSFGSKVAAAATSKSKFGIALKLCGVGYEAYKIVNKIRNKRKVKKVNQSDE